MTMRSLPTSTLAPGTHGSWGFYGSLRPGVSSIWYSRQQRGLGLFGSVTRAGSVSIGNLRLKLFRNVFLQTREIKLSRNNHETPETATNARWHQCYWSRYNLTNEVCSSASPVRRLDGLVPWRARTSAFRALAHCGMAATRTRNTFWMRSTQAALDLCAGASRHDAKERRRSSWPQYSGRWC
jgi:hypothetical protein